MKKAIISAVLALAASAAIAQETPEKPAADSVVIISTKNSTIKKDGIVVEFKTETTTTKVKRSESAYASSPQDTIYVSSSEEKSEDQGFHLSYKNDSKNFHHHLEGLYLGICNYINQDGEMKVPASAPWLKLNDARCLCVDIYWEPFKLPAITKHFALEVGYDIELSHYSLGKDFRLEMRDGFPMRNFSNIPDGGFKRHNLRLAYFGVPIVAEFQFGNDNQYYITAGFKGQVRCPTRTKMIWKEGDERMKDKVKDDFNTRFMRMSLIGGIGFGSWQLFGSICPQGIFKNDMGPEVYPFSIGLKFN